MREKIAAALASSDVDFVEEVMDEVNAAVPSLCAQGV